MNTTTPELLERDQLRKVCDELANATRAEFGNLNWRLDSYSQLHHVAKLHLPSGILRNTTIPNE